MTTAPTEILHMALNANYARLCVSMASRTATLTIPTGTVVNPKTGKDKDTSATVRMGELTAAELLVSGDEGKLLPLLLLRLSGKSAVAVTLPKTGTGIIRLTNVMTGPSAAVAVALFNGYAVPECIPTAVADVGAAKLGLFPHGNGLYASEPLAVLDASGSDTLTVTGSDTLTVTGSDTLTVNPASEPSPEPTRRSRSRKTADPVAV